MAAMLDTTKPLVQSRSAMKKPSEDKVLGVSATTGQAPEPTLVTRKPYQKPRIEKRVAIVANTLVSGQECVFDPPPCG
jgi:hypothetical protein